MNMKDPFLLLVGEVMVDLVVDEEAEAELAMAPLLMIWVKSGRRKGIITTVEAEGEVH